MSVTINVNGNVQSLVVNVGNTGARITANGEEVWSAGSGYPPYLTFSSASAFTLDQLLGTVTWDGTIEYSTDTVNWATWDGSSISAAANNGTYKLYMRGTGNTVITGEPDQGWYLTGSGISCDGDIRTLLDYADPENATAADDCFNGLFSQNDNLIKAPDLLLDDVPARCYRNMFSYCVALTSAPDISASRLGAVACDKMFFGCTALVNAAHIAAVSIGASTFVGMYQGCEALTSISALQTNEFPAMCCASMYAGCSSIKMSATQTGEYQNPFRLPSTGTGTSSSTAFGNMFNNTGGPFIAKPSVNTTYYTSNSIV